ncbi:hypothetical protein CEXT_180881 [Caerostris extrusa]|uniref:Uncharacterized protein n=1 Tax=Caerostris extrusa TaxID=172846 RepID=A0AAV4X8Z7_CAEEX|nr:hypothetical protein CEXT_180881 [Caerostris extrusa]
MPSVGFKTSPQIPFTPPVQNGSPQIFLNIPPQNGANLQRSRNKYKFKMTFTKINEKVNFCYFSNRPCEKKQLDDAFLNTIFQPRRH